MRRKHFALAIVVLATWCVGVAAQRGVTPALSADALEKLRSAARVEMPVPSALDQRIVSLLGVGDDNEQVPSNRLTWLRPEGRHFIYFSLKDGTDDIILTVLSPGITKLYLTDSSRVLRAAGLLEPTTGRTIPVNQAVAGFQEELKIWAASNVALK